MPRCDVIDRLLQDVPLRHDFRPIHHDGLHHGDFLAYIAVELRRIVVRALIHGDLHRVAQGGARHHIDGESHDDEYDDQRDADAHEHLRFQFHLFSPCFPFGWIFFQRQLKGALFMLPSTVVLYTLYRSF